MKAISLWNPWAQLISLGLKHFETRSWWTNFRGPLAIHAAKRRMKVSELNPTIVQALVDHGFGQSEPPCGVIVCTVDLVECIATEAITMSPHFNLFPEVHFGDYSPGRYAWRLTNVRRVNNVPAKGSQGFWEIPDELLQGHYL